MWVTRQIRIFQVGWISFPETTAIFMSLAPTVMQLSFLCVQWNTFYENKHLNLSFGTTSPNVTWFQPCGVILWKTFCRRMEMMM